jgi:hypothetical protein
MAYVFYMSYMWYKSCSFQIPFIPQCVASYHILNYPLVPSLMWIWKTHFTQDRTVDVHLVAKFGNSVGTRKHQRIRIGVFKCQIRIFPGDLSIVQGFPEV